MNRNRLNARNSGVYHTPRTLASGFGVGSVLYVPRSRKRRAFEFAKRHWMAAGFWAIAFAVFCLIGSGLSAVPA